MNEAFVINSGQGEDLNYWCLMQIIVQDKKLHAVFHTSTQFTVGSTMQLPDDSFRTITWMPFSDTKHLNTSKPEFFLPIKFGLNTKFKFGGLSCLS